MRHEVAESDIGVGKRMKHRMTEMHLSPSAEEPHNKRLERTAEKRGLSRRPLGGHQFICALSYNEPAIDVDGVPA